MRYLQLFGKPTKTAPHDADSTNARLLAQAGFVSQLAAGIYSYLPLGLRVLDKVKQIVREEMNALGAQEIYMPALIPKAPWIETGRWETIDVLFKLKGHGDKEYALGSTHEEVVTPLVQQYVHSYKDLPVSVYQIQDKFRNEPRAKAGLLRGREFSMKDLYSFHLTEEDFNDFYERSKQAYLNVFNRCGLDAMIVAASGGAFSKYSHEFQVFTEAGEDTVFQLAGDYVNKEVAATQAPPVKYKDKKELPLMEKEGVGIIGVEALAEHLGISVDKTTKTLLFETDTGEVVAAAVRGGYSVNELKLRDILGCKHLALASTETVKRVTRAEVGYAGLLNLPKEVRIIMDESMRGRINFEMGANKTNYHTINVNFGRDLSEPDAFYDIKMAREGDLDPKTGKTAKTFRAIEVGNIFPLKTRFSDAFGFKVPGPDGKPVPVLMGCYGIGPSRVMGSIVEVHHDERGIVWPKSVAPYAVHLVVLGAKDKSVADKVTGAAESLYDSLTREENIDVLYDDREDVSAGEKFADADLIGIPLRLVVSERTLKEGAVEWKFRRDKDGRLVKLDNLHDEVLAYLKE